MTTGDPGDQPGQAQQPQEQPPPPPPAGAPPPAFEKPAPPPPAHEQQPPAQPGGPYGQPPQQQYGPPPQQQYAPPPQQQYAPPPQQQYAPPPQQQYAPPPQQQYGPPPQQQYGQPYGGYGPPPGQAPTGAAGGPTFGVVGALLAFVGAALGIVAFTAVNWFDGRGNSHLGDVHDVVNRAHRFGLDTGIAKLYYSWLAWVLLGLAVVVAVLANIPGPASGALRGLGVLVGLAGIGVTFWAVQFAHGQAYTEFLKHARVGFYLTLGAFLLTAIGAAVGPRRSTF
jgi:hypothetical protein